MHCTYITMHEFMTRNMHARTHTHSQYPVQAGIIGHTHPHTHCTRTYDIEIRKEPTSQNPHIHLCHSYTLTFLLSNFSKCGNDLGIAIPCTLEFQLPEKETTEVNNQRNTHVHVVVVRCTCKHGNK